MWETGQVTALGRASGGIHFVLIFLQCMVYTELSRTMTEQSNLAIKNKQWPLVLETMKRLNLCLILSLMSVTSASHGGWRGMVWKWEDDSLM